jgi:hypothetical protein
MPNLSYCRFENTLADLRDCYDAIGDTADLSADEREAREELIALCHAIAAECPNADPR